MAGSRIGRHLRWRWGLPLVLAAVVLLTWVSRFRQQEQQRQEQLNIAQQAWDESRYADALKLCEQILKTSPSEADALAIAGLSAKALDQPQLALHWLQQLPQNATSRFVYNGRIATSEVHLELGQVDEAADFLQSMLDTSATDVLVIRRLAELRMGTGDQSAAVSLLNRLVALESASPRELMALAAHADQLWSPDRIRRLRKIAPQDRSLMLAEAKHLQQQLRAADAIELLDQALKIHPRDPQLLLRRLMLLDNVTDAELSQLEGADGSAELWLFLAGLAERVNDRTAIEFARQAFAMEPSRRETNSCLARLLAHAGEAEEARKFVDRAQWLVELSSLCAHRDAFGTDRAARAVGLLRQLGRLREAIAWCRAELRASPQSAWAAGTLDELVPVAAAGSSSISADADQLTKRRVGWTVTQALERLDAGNRSQPDAVRPSPDAATDRSISFVDVAEQTGLRMEFYNGAEAREAGRRMHEFSGGGVGVLDLDHDDWPDLFFPQGADAPDVAGTTRANTVDGLFRNVRGQRFERISSVAGITEQDFGQGVAVGDINNDGFDDLYVAGTRRNRIWINQGDGTFLPQTHPADSGVWTLSVAIADIDSDSVPDLYDVNYLGGENVFTQVCDHDGRRRICGPTDFPAEQDVLWFGSGDGRFELTEKSSGIVQPDGRGMGIIAGDLLQTGRIQILVANDESANFFFEVDEAGRLTETAQKRGIAFGGNGLAQGSMGIAAGHARGRQRLDLFITNYYGEDNCLHVQTADGFLPDLVAQSRLDVPGRAMLGFGTQFLDADSDGDDDLFVANGHLDDFRHLQMPYQMRPQLFENRDGQFLEVSTSSCPWLALPALGRAVARLDWNRDGRMDLCVTHLDRPAALLENQTPPQQPRVMLSYVGVEQSRDAVGTRLTVQPPASRSTGNAAPDVLSILAGDGYECSNQRLWQIVVHDSADRIAVADGRQSVTIRVDPAVPQLWRLVEGRRKAWPVPK